MPYMEYDKVEDDPLLLISMSAMVHCVVTFFLGWDLIISRFSSFLVITYFNEGINSQK